MKRQLSITEVPTVVRYDVPKGSNFTAVSHGFTVLSWALISLITQETHPCSWYPWIRIICSRCSDGIEFSTKCNRDNLDSYIGPGLSAVWIGVLGFSLMATGLVLQSARGFLLKHLIIREFGLD